MTADPDAGQTSVEDATLGPECPICKTGRMQRVREILALDHHRRARQVAARAAWEAQAAQAPP